MYSLLPNGQVCLLMFQFPVCGQGTMKLGRMAKTAASTVNTRRREKGLLPRPVIKLISCWLPSVDSFHFVSPFMQISILWKFSIRGTLYNLLTTS
jgi:hypothetical protein